MSPPFVSKLKHHPALQKLHGLHHAVKGLAADFWKDGTENPFEFQSKDKKADLSFNDALMKVTAKAKPANAKWHAEPGEIAEKMWGEGQLLPCDDAITEALVKPLGVNKDMSILDISAGIGRRIFKLSQSYNAEISGMDDNAAIAARGSELLQPYLNKKFTGISAYSPEHFVTTRNYDALIARELFYRIPNKELFFRALADYASGVAQISFTDYIVDPEHRDQPAIKAWMAAENNAAPLGLVEMAEAWAKAGFNLRVYDDQTDMYKTEVLKGIKRFSIFLGSVKSDTVTKQALLRHIELWALRMAAFEQGMKFYRIYGVRL